MNSWFVVVARLGGIERNAWQTVLSLLVGES